MSKNANEEIISKETYFGWLVEAEYSLKRINRGQLDKLDLEKI